MLKLERAVTTWVLLVVASGASFAISADSENMFCHNPSWSSARNLGHGKAFPFLDRLCSATQAQVPDRRGHSRVPFQCPSPEEGPVLLPAFSTNEPLALAVAPADSICTLTLKTTVSGRDHLSPLARSYDGKDWETTPGPFSIKFRCVVRGDDQTYCHSNELPDFSSSDSGVSRLARPETGDPMLQLQSFSKPPSVDLSREDILARFLEQVTFGPTLSDMAWFDGYNYDQLDTGFAEWVDDQINNVPITSHRRRFREESTTRADYVAMSGAPQHPCDAMTRWHTYAFTWYDSNELGSVEIAQTSDGTGYTMSCDGRVRTEIMSIGVTQNGANYPINPGTYDICEVNLREWEGGRFMIRVNGNCVDFTGGNPPIQFTSQNPDLSSEHVHVITLSPSDKNDFSPLPGTFNGNDFLRSSSLLDASCASIETGAYQGVVFLDFSDGTWMTFNPRLHLLENTLENPAPDAGAASKMLGSRCSNAPRTFLNADSCQFEVGAEACDDNFLVPDVQITLNEDTLRTFYEDGDTPYYVYVITNLQPDPDVSPCSPGERTRWFRIGGADSCASPTDFGDSTTAVRLAEFLRGGNSVGVARFFTASDTAGECDVTSSLPTLDRDIVVWDSEGGNCYKLVHENEYDVYDMSVWVANHPGGPDKITQFAEAGSVYLTYGHPDEMWRWEYNRVNFYRLGIFGQDVWFRSLQSYLRSIDFSIAILGEHGVKKENVVVCGSPFEVANDFSRGETGWGFDLEGADELTYWDKANQRQLLWADTVLKSPDQLRQRVAWVLSQIFAISPSSVEVGPHTESLAAYYDIFLRHSFGNFFDVLKEVSYHPIMAVMLTFLGSRSAASVYRDTGVYAFADENFAREIMQLFTIGTTMMNMDGSPILDPDTNEPMLTYSNEHIMSFARAWTGFVFQDTRGNIESGRWTNFIDPLRIDARWRDIFPKINLVGGFIGDGYPLCTDMPDKSFLRKGAKYRLLGSKKETELSKNPDPWWRFDPLIKMMVLDPASSALYDALCKPSSWGGSDCSFQSEVILDENLLCNGKECDIDTIRILQLSENIYFEYVHQPCVELTYYNDGKKVQYPWRNEELCADPRTAVAGEACCDEGGWLGTDWAVETPCEYAYEHVKFDTAEQRCVDIGLTMCAYENVASWLCDEVCCGYQGFFRWNGASCKLQVKVQDVTGYIAIVHEPVDNLEDEIIQWFDSTSRNYFPVFWHQNYPTLSENCGNGALVCQSIPDGCLCDVVVEETPVFSSAPSMASMTVEDLLSSLHVGNISPDTFDDGYYDPPIVDGDITTYFRQGQGYDADTVFEVKLRNTTKYFRNVQSVVRLLETTGKIGVLPPPSSTYAFRNPPHFMNFVQSDERDAQYETEAVLQHYFTHPNVPPFVAKYFIQRLGYSNPSPRYIQTVAEAFAKGAYEFQDGTFSMSYGSGEYGDLAATVAAVILDSESRSLLMEFDLAKGSLKEPLLKVIHVMRSLEYTTFEGYKQQRHDTKLMFMTELVGQMVYEIESIFSFFRQEYSPSGVVAQSALVAPEAQRYQTPNMIGLLNGLFSLSKYGLYACYGGFGNWFDFNNGAWCSEGQYASSFGKLAFAPTENSDPSVMVDELATLLTAGRLNSESRQMIVEKIDSLVDPDARLRLAQQLIFSTPEFHGTNMIAFNNEAREIPPSPEPSTLPYKAVLFLHLGGGVDSYNTIVPHPNANCNNGKNMYQEYTSHRLNVALAPNEMLEIGTGGESQVCDLFGIHHSLPVLKTLYDEGDLSFFSNVGVLFEHVTKDDWEVKTPTQLFAHNVQTKDSQQIDPYNEVYGTGILGRMADVLTEDGYTTGSFSVSGESYALIGEPDKSPSINFLGTGGVPKFNENPSSVDMRELMFNLNNSTTSTSGKFGTAWSNMYDENMRQYERLQSAYETVSDTGNFPSSRLGRLLQTVKNIISMRETLGHDRHFIYAESGGWDTHLDQPAADLNILPDLNDSLQGFVDVLKAEELFDMVTVVVSSEFGRTFTANSGDGTDHGWGGNYYVFGGSVQGGKMYGKYPDDYDESGPWNIGRGRFIPSTSWDSIHNAVAQWAGVSGNANLDRVLPNRNRFNLYSESDIFA